MVEINPVIVSGVVILILLVTFLLKKINTLLKTVSNGQNEDLVRLIEQNGKAVKEGFSDSRRELREVSNENRNEINVVFKELQDTLLKRISENISIQKDQLDSFSKSLNELSEKLFINFNDFKENINESFQRSNDALNKKQDEFRERTDKNFTLYEESIKRDAKENRKELNAALKSFEGTIENQLKFIREDNSKQLSEMRRTVDEKLQTTLEKRLGESFKQVSERLEQVHKGLGEMQSLATGVGDLKKVLSNVKTRGILGEYQLGNILEQILSPQQYAKNVATKKGSQANVEYAVKLPGKNQNEEIWIPIDSKFPLEGYNMLLRVYEDGEQSKIELVQRQLLKTIENFAKDIKDKYIDPPHTTDFGIMFLPVEGLYAEVLRHPWLFEKLQRHYCITITGPTTLSAFLNSLQMGYRTLAIQKRSSEVWKVLGAVKTEFSRFSEQLSRVHKQLNTAANSLETLRNTRTHIMEKKLQSVESLDSLEAKKILVLPE